MDEELKGMTKKLAHEVANLLYLVREDYGLSAQYQATMNALNNYLIVLAGPVPVEEMDGQND